MTDTEDPALREVAAAVVVHEGRVLVQTRPGPGRYQGFWEFPGGGREEGESLSECVVREVDEELGLAVRVVRSFDVVEWSYPGARVRVEFLLCAAVDARPVPEAREGQEFRWAAATELDGLRFLPANAGVLEKLVETLSSAR